MPSYFYHLKFELYPSDTTTSSTPPPTPSSISSTANTRDIFVPPLGSDIFDTRAWPAHRSVDNRGAGNTGAEKRARGGAERGIAAGRSPTAGTEIRAERGGAVIDCGPARGDSRRKEDSYVTSLLVHRPRRELDVSPRGGAVTPSDLETTKKDWRFGAVRIEGVDMVSKRKGSAAGEKGEEREREREREIDRPGHRRGESSTGNTSSGINAGLETGQAAVGRVTKGRFEAAEGKGTDVGWGVVHLYRDGEETVGLGGGVEVYDTRGSANTGGDNGGLSVGSKNGEGEALEEDCTTLCIPAVPGYFTQSDFLGFVGEKTMQEVSHFRMVMTGRMNRYMVLMKFRDGNAARRWRAEWDGKVFNSMEPETCHVAFIRTITFQTPSSSLSSKTSYPELSHDPFFPSTTPSTNLKPFPPPTPNLVELPTCPVCLERMDDTTGLLTILCQHVFHCACLQKWRGSGCPVCRHTNPSPFSPPSSASNSNNPFTASSTSNYPHDTQPPFGSPTASLCSICDCPSDLWICLICGNVGCGRYKGGHAKEHWKETAHNFALEIETQHVWDYAGDLWVHRLIRDKGDSKVIELPPGLGRGGDRGDRDGRGGGGNGYGDGHGEVDMVPREKLERIGLEYTHLLTSQLESQRVYFEELVSKAVSKASSASSLAASASASANEALSRLRVLDEENKNLREEVIPGLERDLAREKKKAERSAEVARGFGKSLMEEKKVSEGLMERIEFVNGSMMGLAREIEGLKVENAELKEENRDLLFSISAGERLRGMVKEEEGEGGGVVVEGSGGSGSGSGMGTPQEEKLARDEVEGGTVSLPPPPLTAAEKRRMKGKGKIVP